MHIGKIAVTAAALALTALIGQTAANASSPSDSNMAYVSRYVGEAAVALQNDKSDYAGHRAAAIADINRARTEIANALAYSAKNGNYAATSVVNVANESAFERTQGASDKNLAYVKTIIQHAIDMLQNDRPDYNGHRVNAIVALQAARAQLGTALVSSNPTMSSDANIRYTRGYIARGISMLQQDQTNYKGHRAAAVTALRNADADLLAALRADRADESIPSVQALAPMAQPVGPVMGQRKSDNNIRYAQSYVGHAIDMLHQDQHDYNGYRAKAVQQLVIARNELVLALQSRQ
jgi:hypothetical protein